MAFRPSILSADDPGYSERYALRPGAQLAVGGRSLFLLRRELAGRSTDLGAPDALKKEVLRRLATGGGTAAELGLEHPAGALAFLDVLRAGGWLTTTVSQGGHDLYTLQPTRPPRPRDRAGAPVLSRFAVSYRESEHIVLESPLAEARLVVHDPSLLAIVGVLARPLPAGAAPDPLRDRLVEDLRRVGLVVTESSESGLDQRQWRPGELWLHGRIRLGNGGYAGAGFGRTFWARSGYEPLPAGRPAETEPGDSAPAGPGPGVDLYRPDIGALRASDRTLTEAMEDRRSVRAHDDATPITATQLGELLYRCARVRQRYERDGHEYENRPYPSGGSVYELELYPVVRLVAGLDPGLYRYDPYEHRLRLVQPPGVPVDRLLHTAMVAGTMAAQPQVVIVLAARFGRLMYSYEELPYSLILKHVGVLYQSMYLVATAMGLAACALGAGDAQAFLDATGLDFTTESSVGEFLLGSRAPIAR